MRTPLQRWWWWDPPRGVGLECHGQPWCWGGGGCWDPGTSGGHAGGCCSKSLLSYKIACAK